MNEIYYYLLLGVVLYYIFTRVIENFSLNQENFDPSLVPISSIVTLAKVAQKLVNGNGTLTNPGNLQIGASTSSPGNLTVTGTSTVSGNSTVSGTSTVSGNSTVSGTMGITGNTTVGGTMGITGATTVGGTLGVTGATTVGGTLGVTGATTLNSTLNLNSTGSNFLRINKGAVVDANTVSVWRNDPGELTFVGQNAANTDYSWPGIKLDTRNSKITANTLQVTGNTTVGTLGVTGAVTASGAVGGSANGQIQIGSWDGGPAIYANDSAKSLAIHSDGAAKNVQIGLSSSYPNSLTVTGNLKVDGNLTVSSKDAGSNTTIYNLAAQVRRLEYLVGGIMYKQYVNGGDGSDTIQGDLITNINDLVKNGTIKNYTQCINSGNGKTGWRDIGNSAWLTPYQLRGYICGQAGYFTGNYWSPGDTADVRTPQWK